MVNAWLTQAAGGAATTAATQSQPDSSTLIATDAFVQTAVYGANGFLGVNCRIAEMAGQQTQAVSSGRLYVQKVPVFTSAAVGTRTIWYGIATAGATLTSGDCLVAAFTSAGTLQGSQSADQSTTWTTAGQYSTTVGSFALTAGTYIYIGFVSTGTTNPKFVGVASGAPIQVLNMNLSGANLIAATAATGVTNTISSFTASSLGTSNGPTFIACGIT